MEAKKYLINPRGRRINPVSEKEAEQLVKRGFTEVTQAEWSAKEYFPEHGKGEVIKPLIVPQPKQSNRKLLNTKVV